MRRKSMTKRRISEFIARMTTIVEHIDYPSWCRPLVIQQHAMNSQMADIITREYNIYITMYTLDALKTAANETYCRYALNAWI